MNYTLCYNDKQISHAQYYLVINIDICNIFFNMYNQKGCVNY